MVGLGKDEEDPRAKGSNSVGGGTYNTGEGGEN